MMYSLGLLIQPIIIIIITTTTVIALSPCIILIGLFIIQNKLISLNPCNISVIPARVLFYNR